jgi:hypothetical protein
MELIRTADKRSAVAGCLGEFIQSFRSRWIANIEM